MKAYLKNYRQSPRKVRLVARAISGKSVADALLILSFMPKRAALPLTKLIASAEANAKDTGVNTEGLKISTLEVNQGVTLKRIRARARGSAFRINKRTSNVTVTLKGAEEAKPSKKTAVAKKPAEKAVEKTALAKKPAAKKKVATKKTAKAAK
ncbi:50S ribosomal protein L22 [Candidatus Parcubacteria bacterium]|nr:50S ribosomal protein L22 [Candidatus Parcubacteria bacterium]